MDLDHKRFQGTTMDISVFWQHPRAIIWWMNRLMSENRDDTWIQKMKHTVKTILEAPIQVELTTKRFGFFYNHSWPVRDCNDILRQWHASLLQQASQHDAFKTREKRADFRDVKYTNYKYNSEIEKTFDRVACVAWLCWWILTVNPGEHWFLSKDICLATLQKFMTVNLDTKYMQLPPFKTKKTIRSIQCIYDCVNQMHYDSRAHADWNTLGIHHGKDDHSRPQG